MISAKWKTSVILPLVILSFFVGLQHVSLAHAATSWSSPTLIDSNSGFNLLSSSLQATNGTMWIAWQSDRNAQITGRFDILYKTYTNGFWSISRNLTTTGQNAGPSLVQLSNGTIGVFWSQKVSHSYQVFYSQYRTTGWTPPNQIASTTLNDTQVSATVGRDGTVWLAWTRVDSTNPNVPAVKQLFYKTLKNGVWSPDTQLTTDSNQNYGSGIMIGKDGIVRVTWSKGAPGSNYQIFQKTYNGVSWSPDTQLVSSSSTDEHPSMLQDRNGTLWTFWGRLIVVSLTVQYYVLMAKYSYNMGTTWSSEMQLTNTSTSVDSFTPSAVQSTYSTKPIWIFYTSNLNVPTYDIFAITSSGIGPIHDVSVTGVYASSSLATVWEYPGGLSSVGQSAIVTITVTVANAGDFSQTVYVNLTATNSTNISIGQRSGFVGPGGSVNIYFFWNTTNVKPARYGMAANLLLVPGETYGNSFDNVLNVSNQMHILPLGDVDQDGSVTLTDVSVFFYNFDFTPSCNCSRWNPYADINGNGIIDIVDIGVVSRNFDIFT
jgi:hypothetical protein